MKISFGRSEYQGEGQAGEVGYFKPYKRKVYTLNSKLNIF